MDIFSRNLKLRMEQGVIQSFHCSRRVSPVSHLLFADDILIFSNGNVRSVKNLNKLLQDFCKASGQVVSLDKSKFFVQNKFRLGQVRKIQQVLNFHKGSLPTSYLGVPLFTGRAKVADFDFIMDKIRRKITGWKAKLLSWGGKITVISSILNSIPIFALSVLPVPQKVIANIQRSIADFLWNQGDQRRLHWVSWNKVAKPIEEGGLNLKLLSEVSYFGKSKLAWSYLQNKSLWSNFMNQRYKLGSVTCLDSKLWKSLVPLIIALNAESFWKVGKGQILFWTQKWWSLDINIIQPDDLPDIPISEVWNDLRRKETYIAALPEELQQVAVNLHLSSSEDSLVWKGSESGEFSSRGFRNLHSISSVDRCSWWKKFWQPWIPSKISCFLWKCMNQAVPVDEAIQRAKVPFVSKCVCCANGNMETLHHLFLEGEAARAVWQFLQGIFDVNGTFHSFRQAAARWVQFSSTNSQLGCLRILAFAVAIWELWKWRNKAIFDQPENPGSIRHKIIYQIQQFNALIVPGRSASWREELAITSLHIPRLEAKRRKGIWVSWLAATRDLTVNIHVSAKGQIFQGSFVARNSEGLVSWCSSWILGECQDNFQAYMITLKEAIVTVQSSGQRISEIQVVEGKIVDCWSGKKPPPWRWDDQFQVLKSSCEGISLRHIEKERNQAAVAASSFVLGVQTRMELQNQPEIRQLLEEDRLGLARWSWL